MKLNDGYDKANKRTIPGALSLLVKAGRGASIARPNGVTVRRAVGHDEQTLHGYVTQLDDGTVVAYDATAEELAADDWELTTKKAAPAAAPTSKETPTAKGSLPRGG